MKLSRSIARKASARVSVAVLCGVAFYVTTCSITGAQTKVPSPREVVAPEVYASSEPAARGVPFQLAVVMRSGRDFM